MSHIIVPKVTQKAPLVTSCIASRIAPLSILRDTSKSGKITEDERQGLELEYEDWRRGGKMEALRRWLARAVTKPFFWGGWYRERNENDSSDHGNRLTS